ncbi:MAG TPA: hypothetical protein VNT55_04390 [Baekduia sp.]|nr:hypothetical protein [Baekduia sp.]
MVNQTDSFSLRSPGAAFWLLALLGLPILGVVAIDLVLFSAHGGGFQGPRGSWCVTAIALVAAAVLAGLPRLRRMAPRARCGWTLCGAVLTLVLSGGYTVALVFAALIYACELGESCLS